MSMRQTKKTASKKSVFVTFGMFLSAIIAVIVFGGPVIPTDLTSMIINVISAEVTLLHTIQFKG
jgi:hypothetical protein